MGSWDPKYLLNVDTFDNQHKEIFKLLDDITQAIEKGDNKDISFIVTKLEVYSWFHLASEDHAMAKYRYPGIEIHMEEHEKFRNAIKTFKEIRSENEMEKLAGLRDFVQDWIMTHIEGTDKAYAPFFIEKGFNNSVKKTSSF